MSRRRNPTRETVYGRHAVAALLDTDPAGVVELLIAVDAHGEAIDAAETAARTHGLGVTRVRRTRLDRLADGGLHQGLLARVRRSGSGSGTELAEFCAAVDRSTLLLVLDGVEDPHNLGAALRTAEAAGASAVMVPRSRGAGLTATVRKVASGAAERVPLIVVANLARALEQIGDAGVHVVGAVPEASDSLYDCDLTGALALVLGAEGAGLRSLTRRHCDRLASIPMAGAGGSLNVSVAAGVCLFESVRQRHPSIAPGPQAA